MHSKITYLTFTCVFWILSSSVFAQVSIDVVKNKSGQIFLTVDQGTIPTFTSPLNGNVTYTSAGNVYTFLYKPTNDFLGSDTFSVNYIVNSTSTSKFYNITVRQAKVIAIPDLYAYDFIKKVWSQDVLGGLFLIF